MKSNVDFTSKHMKQSLLIVLLFLINSKIFGGIEEGISSPGLITTISFRVNTPNGGENLGTGSLYQITWSYIGPSDKSLIIEYTTNNGAGWQNITTLLATSSPYNWTIPNTPTTQAKIRISSNDYPAIGDTSNNVFTIWGTPATVQLTAPIIGAINQPINTTFNWGTSTNATQYHLQVSTDSVFATLFFNDSLITSTSRTANGLTTNRKYWWRVRAKNPGNLSSWSEVRSFYTLINPPNLASITPTNKKITITWTQSPNTNIAKFRIYRDTSTPATTLIDSVLGTQLSFVDNNLTNGTPYYYRIKAVNNDGIESAFSNSLNSVPVNISPTATQLQHANLYNSGRVLTRELTFSSAGSVDPDGTIDSIFWYINNTIINNNSNLTHNFPQGTHRVKLLVKDNDGATDSSIAIVNISAWRKSFSGPVQAGLSLLGDSLLYAVSSGSGIYRMDIDGNVEYNLLVNGNILSSSSIGYDTTVYIGSTDYNLYSFSKFGAPLWPALALGGELTATPAIDSVANQIYIGVSNRNFFAINRSSGQVSWNYFSDAAINGSAVITSDKKLVFSSVKGTVYGFNLKNLPNPITPTWIINTNDSISTSPAIDNNGFIYIGTKNGKAKKIAMPVGSQGVVVWETMLEGEITASPVIDAGGNIYFGSSNKKLYKLDNETGNIEWEFSTNAPIKTTPAISNNGIIYLGNNSGEMYAIDTTKQLIWYYKDSSGFGSALLYHKGTAYAGTLNGRVIAIYDGLITTENSENNTKPIWGTFQGNNQRTGEQSSTLSSINGELTEIPVDYELSQNFPNPFNPSTIIRFGIPYDSNVKLVVYNILGEVVNQLLSEELKAGFHEVAFNQSNLPSGIYFYSIEAKSITGSKDFKNVRKMILVK